MYKIEKNIAVYPYPFDEMEVSDSFLIECKKDKSSHETSKVHVYARRKKLKITARTVENGIRVWLISK